MRLSPFARRAACRVRSLAGRFGAADQGVAAVEAAIILPVLVLLLLGTFEITRYIMVGKRLGNVAASIAQVVAASDRALDRTDLEFLENVSRIMPNIKRDNQAASYYFRQQVQIAIASVEFLPESDACQEEGCKFKARVDATYGTMTKRQCGYLTSMPDSQATDFTKLPASLFGPGSVVVVDVNYHYLPIFGSAILPSSWLFIKRSAFAAPRYVDLAMLRPADGYLNVCSG